MKRSIFLAAAFAFLYLPVSNGLALTLDVFQFNDAQFGNTLSESDGGEFRAINWLNVVNADPGNPGALTGANVNTGIANIGLGSRPTYTIGYDTPIANGNGADLGIISAFSAQTDTFSLAVSTNGINFSSFINFGPGTAVGTGVVQTYFYGRGTGQSSTELFVTSVDLTLFGLNLSDSISAIQITGFREADLIRVAGFGPSASVPEGGTTIALLGAALFAIGVVRSRCARQAAQVVRSASPA